MKIYKISTKKEAHFSDFFKPNAEKFEKIAIQFVEEYWNKKDNLPTVGEIILDMMNNKDLKAKNINQDFLKTIASSVLSSFRNKTLKGI